MAIPTGIFNTYDSLFEMRLDQMAASQRACMEQNHHNALMNAVLGQGLQSPQNQKIVNPEPNPVLLLLE